MKTIRLGSYATEEDAAYAYVIGAPLIHDPEFLCLVPIPDDRLPSQVRCQEIHKFVIERIKAKLAGGKSRSNATSKYIGVKFIFALEKWAARIVHQGAHYETGGHANEHDAAFSYNCMIAILRLFNLKPNAIEIASLPGVDEQESIRKRAESVVEARLAGLKTRQGATSQMAGVSYFRRDACWQAFASKDCVNYHLGYFATETEAAFAADCGTLVLTLPRRINLDDASDALSPSRQTAIKESVIRKITDRQPRNPQVIRQCKADKNLNC